LVRALARRWASGRGVHRRVTGPTARCKGPGSMAGHSKWNNIKRKKGAVDAKRGKLFTKLSREIQVASRLGGGDPAGNPRLRLAIQTARAQSMPMDNIERAIKKGTGDLEGKELRELVYEGYGPGGVAYMLEVTTDNPTRTLNEVRNAFEKSGGSFAKSGAVAFQFEKRGMLRFSADRHSEDDVTLAAAEAGAEDVVTEDEDVVVYTEVAQFHAVQEALEAAGYAPERAELTMIPSATVRCDEREAAANLKLWDRLDDNDDVANIWANLEVDPEVWAWLQGAD
jgi:YebC/PmpR family DNA-binding regulatory protein